MMITSVSGPLRARVGPFDSESTHRRFDTFELVWTGGARTFITFALDGEGRPSTAVVEHLGDFTAAR